MFLSSPLSCNHPSARWPRQRRLRSPPSGRPAPDVTYAAKKRRESIAAVAPATARNQVAVTATPAGGARGPREVRGSEGPETDPGGIIDWLLSEYPARSQ